MTPPIEIEEVATPDVPSSSPGIDAMDVSPLPHKAPYLVTQVTLPSPSPERTPAPDNGSTPGFILSQESTPIPAPALQPPTFLPLPEYGPTFQTYQRPYANTAAQTQTSSYPSFAYSRQDTVFLL